MFYPSKELQERALAYATARGIELEQCLGGGKDGTVYSTSDGTAIKAFRQSGTFRREWACYERLKVLEDEYGIYMLDVHPGNISFG
ncbi:MAG: hypothetical protein FWD53_06205 [Phycisphaerales bacterium]|nr:hypothetical protein [Phycisphaerales bacterium]